VKKPKKKVEPMTPEIRQRLFDLKLTSKMGTRLDAESQRFVEQAFAKWPKEFREVEDEVRTESIKRMRMEWP
jgi:hypothetical protein